MRSFIYKSTAGFLIFWFPVFIVVPVYAQFQFDEDENYFSDESGDSSEDTDLEESTETETMPSDEVDELNMEEQIDNTSEETDMAGSEEIDMTGSEGEYPVETTDSDIEKTEMTEPENLEDEYASPAEASDTDIDKQGTTESSFSFEAEASSIIESDDETDKSKASTIQNALLEGIQLSKEPGEASDESIITCYFIFRDKPTSYFYESKKKEKTILFEFTDVNIGSSPIPSVKEPPIQGFRIESVKINANKDVVGLNPEWHDILKVSFFFDQIPKITVKDEYSIISFTFKWSSNPEKLAGLVEEGDKKKAPLILSLVGSVAALGGVGLYLFFRDDGPHDNGEGPLGIDDRPVHPEPQ